MEYTLQKAHREFDAGVSTLRRWIRDGQLPARKVTTRYGDAYVIKDEDLIQAMQKPDPVQILEKALAQQDNASLVPNNSQVNKVALERLLTLPKVVDTLSNTLSGRLNSLEQALKTIHLEIIATRVTLKTEPPKPSKWIVEK